MSRARFWVIRLVTGGLTVYPSDARPAPLKGGMVMVRNRRGKAPEKTIVLNVQQVVYGPCLEAEAWEYKRDVEGLEPRYRDGDT